MLRLEAGDYRLDIEPERGGSIARFEWRNQSLMRSTRGPSILDTACFPLVPFSNRIADGRFASGGREVQLSPNMPGGGHPHPMHGFGWLSKWEIIDARRNHATLEHCYAGGEWPWPYRARQRFELDDDGLALTLSVENGGETPMPAGLGFHPYFPRDDDTTYLGFHNGEWQNSADCLPRVLQAVARPIDWWNGQSVGSRAVDTAYSGRAGPLRINWPSRGLCLTMLPSDELDHTVIYTPEGADFFCVEPVSHATNAVNATGVSQTMVHLDPQELLLVGVRFEARSLSV